MLTSFFYSFVKKIIDEFSNGGDLTSFFNALGNGSPSDVQEGSSEDDDAAFEKQQQVSLTYTRRSNEVLINFVMYFSSRP